MIIDDKFINEKLQCAIDREAAKVSALSLSKIDKYEYLSGEGILPPNKNRVIEQAKFTYYSLRKVLESKRRNILMLLIIFIKNKLNNLIIDKLKETIQLQNNIKLDDPEYTTQRGKSYNFSK